MTGHVRQRRRGRLREIFGASKKPPTPAAAPQATAVPVSRAGPSTLTPVAGNPGERLLKSALAKLSPDEGEVIRGFLEPDTDSIAVAVRDAHGAAQRQKQACESKRWTWNFRGKTVVLRDEAEKIMRWLDGFKSVGDIVSNADPILVGLPWAGIRMLLQMTVNESQQMAALLTGMDLALYMSSRLEAYLVFFQRLPATPARALFEEALVEMYAHILGFLVTAIRTFPKSTAARTLHALWSTSNLENFESDCDKLGARTETEVSNCDRELLVQDREDVKKWRADLSQTLQKLDDIRSLRDVIDRIHVKVDLSRLSTAAGATYDSFEDQHTAQCLPGTRKDLLARISAWSHDPRAKSIFWLCGMAGTGKSTVARTVAHALHAEAVLGASFFFKRGEGDRGTARRFFPTVVRQLVDEFPDSGQAVAEALERDSLLCDKSLEEQFKKLLQRPFASTVSGQTQLRDLVVVIDALDECDRDEDVAMILELFARLDGLGSLRLRVFVTSRPELPIQIGFRKMNGDLHEDVVLEEVQSDSIEHDLKMFFDQSFADIKAERMLTRQNDALPVDWPAEADVQMLVDLATPLFIFASTMCRFIAESRPQGRLISILQRHDGRAYSGMAKTYLPILEQVIAQKEEELRAEFLQDFRDIVGSIVLVADPLSVSSLSSLLQVNQETIHEHLDHLHSVLSVPRDPHLPVRLLHLSFRDFLVDTARKDRSSFWIAQRQTHAKLAGKCLELLSRPGVLNRDICGVERPGTKRVEVSWAQVTGRIPPDVAYACKFWASHVLDSGEELCDERHELDDPETLCDEGQVLYFLQEHFLHWLEALTWLDRLPGVIGSLIGLQSRVKGTRLAEFLHDALRFVLQNRYMIDIAPPQVYGSALAFAPRESVIRTTFAGEFRELFDLYPAVPTDWGAELQKLEGHDDKVTDVAFSPDGESIASVSEDRTIRLWNAQTGEQKRELVGPLGGSIAFSNDGRTLTCTSAEGRQSRQWNVHTEKPRPGFSCFVRTGVIAASPDGRLIATVYRNSTILLSNSRTGELMYSLEDCFGVIEVLAFSPDGQYIASGSLDGVVQLWNVKSDTSTYRLGVRDHGITCLIFSPDSQIVAASASDGTVLLWRLCLPGGQTQELKCHETSVTALALSYDMQFLASASRDLTVRLWDTRRGQEILRLEYGEDCGSLAIALSPVSHVLAVASYGTDIQLWDVLTGKQIRGQKFHGSNTKAVPFSPDGHAVASESLSYGTMQLRKTKTGGQIKQLQGPDGNLVRSTITFAPDGTVIGSTYQHGTIRLWNSRTCEQVQFRIQSVQDWDVVTHPDGCMVVTLSMEGNIQVWDGQTGELLSQWEHRVLYEALAPSPDGRYVARGLDNGVVQLWDVEGCNLVKQLVGEKKPIVRVAVSPDRRVVATLSLYGTLQLWYGQTTKHTLEKGVGVGNISIVPGMAAIVFSPDGKIIAVPSFSTVQLLDAQSAKLQRTLRGHRDRISTIDFSTSGKFVATGSFDGTVRLWDAQIGSQIGIFEGHTSVVSAVAISPSGQLMASGSEDRTIRLWDTRAGAITQGRAGLERDGVKLVTLSPNGQLAASRANSGIVRLWDTQTGEEIREVKGSFGGVAAVVFSPDSSTLATASFNSVMELWDMETGTRTHLLESHIISRSVRIVFSPDGQAIASVHSSGVILWDTRTGEQMHRFLGSGKQFVAFSPDGRLMARVFSPHTDIVLRNAQTGVRTARFAIQREVFPTAIRFAPDARTVVILDSAQLSLYSTETGIMTQAVDLPRSGGLLSRCVSPSRMILRFAKFTEDGRCVRVGFNFYALEWTSSGMLNVPLREADGIAFDGRWIRNNGQDIVYLPKDYRGTHFDIYQNTLAIGHASGLVTFFRLRGTS